jgi:hypothetical protein
MDNRNTTTTTTNENNTAPAATEAALYDANITVTALRQQLFVSERATLRAQQLAETRAGEAELQLEIVRLRLAQPTRISLSRSQMTAACAMRCSR